MPLKNHIYCVLIGICFIGNGLFGQEAQTNPKLKKAIVFFEDSSDLNQTLHYAHQAYQEGMRQKNDRLRIESSIYLTLAYSRNSSYKDSAQYFYKIASQLSKRKTFQEFEIPIELSYINYLICQGNTDEASDLIFPLIEKIKKSKNRVYLAWAYKYNSIIDYYSKFLLKKKDQMIQHCKLSIGLFEQVNKKCQASFETLRLVTFYNQLNERAKALRLLDSAYQVYPNLHHGYGKLFYLNCKSILYGSNKQYLESIQVCEEALVLCNQLKLKIEKFDFQLKLGVNYNYINDIKGQKRMADSLALYIQNNKDNVTLSMYYNYLTNYYEQIEDYKKAYLAFSQLDSVTTIMSSENLNKKINELETKYKTKEKDAKISELKKEKQLTNYKLYILIVCSIAFLLFIFILAAIKINQVKREKLIINHQKEILELETSKRIKALEIQILYAQMNPHFVFNCLSAIQHLFLKGDHHTANSKLTSFSRLLRLSIDHVKNDYVSLADELNFLKHYIELEKLQFNEPFEFELINSCETNSEDIKIPSMILQPYIENAINHGLKNKEGDRKLSIIITEEISHLLLKIEDNGIGRLKSEAIKSKLAYRHESKGLGLINEKIEAIKELYNDPVHIETMDLLDEKNEAIGTRIIVKFNKHLYEDPHY
jgi:hypothetical protein